MASSLFADLVSSAFRYQHSQRLSALDRAFLDLEDANVHMHVGSVGLFEPGPLVGADGSLDMARVRREIEAGLRGAARMRQRLRSVPLFDQPVWVDDPHFNLDYHVRHTSLPAPGDERQLKRLAGRILSEKLEMHRPLWELWFVEGLEDGGFAVIAKIHHAVIDGVSGVDLMGSYMALDPEGGPPGATGRWIPRPGPGPGRLVLRELSHRVGWPLELAGAAREALRDPAGAARGGAESVRGLVEALGGGLSPGGWTPLNDPIGPHRRFDWTHFELEAVAEVRRRHGGTLNDVAVTVGAGALRRFLQRRHVDVDALDFRALLPVSVRRRTQRGKLGNRVAFLMARLPLDEPDPVRRLARVVESTRHLKRSGQAAGGELIEEVADRTWPGLVSTMLKQGCRSRAFHTVLTNVPGPPVPAWLLGCRMRSLLPVVPLFSHQALGMALFSYAGSLSWGLHADWDAVPDLHDFVADLQAEFERLRKA